MEIEKGQLKQAANASLASLLNLTLLPIVGFIVLLTIYKKTQSTTYANYYAVLGLKINLFAGAALILVSILIASLIGFYSPWTWVFVISYFVFVHALFILLASWVLVRSWTGEKLKKSLLSK